MASSFVSGVNAAVRGLSMAMGSDEVRRTYLRLVMAILALTVALDAAGIWAAFTLIPDGDDVAGSIGYWLLRIAAIAIVLLAAPVVAVFVANIGFPLLNEGVFLAGVRALDPARADDLRAREGLPLSNAMLYSVRRLITYLIVSAFALALSLVPVVGPVLGPATQVWVTARALGWELLDPWLDKHRLDYAAQRAYLRRQRGAVVGFAVPYSFVMAIPLVGPLTFGIAQAAIAVLALEVLDSPDATSHSPSHS